MNVASDQARLSKGWSLWVGSTRDLGTLLEYMASAVDVDAYIDRETQYEQNHVVQAEREASAADADTVGDEAAENSAHAGILQRMIDDRRARTKRALNDAQQRLEEARDKARGNTALRASRESPGVDLTKQGSPSEIAAWASNGTFDRLRVEVGQRPSDTGTITLVFHRKIGVQLVVASNDEGWAALRFDHMRRLIDDGAPRSKWIVSALPAVPFVGAFALNVAVGGIIVNGSAWEIVVAFAAIALIVFLTGQLSAWIHRTIPRVELHTGRPKSAVVAAVISIAAAVFGIVGGAVVSSLLA